MLYFCSRVSKIETKVKYKTYRLSNGLRIVQAPSLSKVVYCGYVLNAGTRDEEEDELGMAHFVEHLIFKGTTHRKAWHILNRMERVGGDLNAFTNKEETTVYSTFLAEHFSRAAELLTDIVFHSTFPQAEIDREVEVIIDEIQSYQDSPSEQIFDDFEELVFRGHPLGRNILGVPELLRSFSTVQALQFTSRYYRPDNAVFFLWGNIDLRQIVRTLERLTADLSFFSEKIVLDRQLREAPGEYFPQQVEVRRATHQAHVILGTRAYHAYDERRTALYLLNNVLGGPGMNSRLNVSLRERRGLVYGVESNLTSYTDSGLFSIYFGTDTEDVSQCLDLVYRELRELREKGLSAMQLAAAKKQIIGQIAISADNSENMAMDLGKSFLHYDRFDSIENLFSRIEALTSSQLLQVANEILDENNLSTLIYI